MKYFGEYLVEKQIVSADNLVQAVLEQNQSQPLAARIAFERKLLSAEELIKVFGFQQEHQLDFLAAGQASGLLTNEKKAAIEQEMKRHHVPLAEILLKNGSIAVKEIVHALDEFLSTAKEPSLTASALPNKSGTENAKILPNFSFQKIDSTFGIELQEALSDSHLQEMINVIQLVKQNAAVKELVHEFLQDVLKSVHIIRGLAKASKAQVIEHVCSMMDAAIVKELRNQSIDSKFINETLTPSLEKALYYCRLAKESIANKQSEQEFWETPSNQEEFKNFAKSLLA